MRRFKLAGILSLLALAVVAFSAAGSAYASNPEALLLESKGGFSFTSGAGELVDSTSGLAIKCKSDKGTGEITGAKSLTASVTFEKCNVGGLAAQSLGGKSGQITLSKLAGGLCYINAEKHQVGALLTLPSEGVHIEVPSLGELLIVTGSTTGLLSPDNEATKSGKLSFGGHKCEGATGNEDVLLLELEHSGTTLAGEEISEESITYAGSVELMA